MLSDKLAKIVYRHVVGSKSMILLKLSESAWNQSSLLKILHFQLTTEKVALKELKLCTT